MYQETIEDLQRLWCVHDISIFELAEFSLAFPGTKFSLLQPNPELARLDATLAVMCRPDDEFEDFPVIPRGDRMDDLNAITFIEPKILEKLFEMYDQDRALFESHIYQLDSDYSSRGPSRSYHPGRVYGSGQYGNSEEERRYQLFIRDPYLVFEVLDEFNRQQANRRSESRRYKWDESEVCPYDLLDMIKLEQEPFIRAPVVSDEAAEIIKEEFYYSYNRKPMWTEDDE
jgi:hypothetical protein